MREPAGWDQDEKNLPRTPQEAWQDAYHGLQVLVERTDHVANVVLRGELDLATAPLLERHLEAARADGASTIVIDLDLLTFMDSSGPKLFLQAAKEAEDLGGRLVLADCGATIRKVFALTGTEALLESGDSDRRTEGGHGIPE